MTTAEQINQTMDELLEMATWPPPWKTLADMSQTEMLLEHFKRGYGLTGNDAKEMFGIGRLPARVKDLKKAGYMIDDRWVDVKNRFGKPVRVKEYFFPRGDK